MESNFMLKKFIIPEIVIFLSAFALYSFLAILAPTDIWNSPDETANAFFINRLADTGSLTYFDPAVARSGGLIHPRSISVRDGLLVPGSFVGMIVFYALPVRLFGHWVLPFLTPFFSALALIAFGSILKKFLSPRAARLSVILAMFHPAFWYYANRGLFHNVFFLDCVIFAFYFALVRPGPRVNGLLAGSAFILAMAARTFEAIWLLPTVSICLFINLSIYHRKKIKRETFFAYGILILMAGAILLFISYAVYGNFFLSGYPRIDLLPFGFSLKNMTRNGIWYGRLFFWWYTIIISCGILYLIYLRIKRRVPAVLWRGLLVLLGISLPLFIIYGSGAYLDSPDPRVITIGNSLVRYWLPLYIGSIPFGAWFLDKAVGYFKSSKIQMLFLTAIVLSVGLLSFRVVFFGYGEGLAKVIIELKRYKEIRAATLVVTPPNAIIISDRSDKIFFPYRHVVLGTDASETMSSLDDLVSFLGPLYVYALKMDATDVRLGLYERFGFILDEKLQFSKERLYSLRKK